MDKGHSWSESFDAWHDGECEVLNLKDYDRCYCRVRQAAPALLEALEYCMDLIVFLRTPDHPAVTTAFDKARAAIAQARGKEQS